MKRGRKPKSQIRQNIIDILFFLKHAYGYEIYRIYRQIFPRTTLRSIYYHLNKGIETGEFTVEKVEKEEGKYSWGSYAEKVYYKLGPNAKTGINLRVRAYLKNKGLLKEGEGYAEKDNSKEQDANGLPHQKGTLSA